MSKPQKYLSQTEIGEMTKKIGWGDQRKIAVLIKRGKFPEPDVMIGKTKGWKLDKVEGWLQSIEEIKRV